MSRTLQLPLPVIHDQHELRKLAKYIPLTHIALLYAIESLLTLVLSQPSLKCRKKSRPNMCMFAYGLIERTCSENPFSPYYFELLILILIHCRDLIVEV